MKPRRVVITIECDTDEPLAHLRAARHAVLQRPGCSNCHIAVEQIQANVIRQASKATRRKKKR